MPNEKIPEKAGLTKNGIYKIAFDWSNLQKYTNSKYNIGKKYLDGLRFSYPDNIDTKRRAVASLLDVDNWSVFVNEYSDTCVGSPTIEMWIKSWNDLYPDDKLYYTIDKTGLRICF